MNTKSRDKLYGASIRASAKARKEADGLSLTAIHR
jgi:hypothetical protein